jgi:crotonobetainyl-CoA:carnitine CoA-transferase CaiB-like acyl-CoA transferase
MGEPQLAQDPRFVTRHTRLAHKDAVYEVVSGWTKRHTKKELIAILGGRVSMGPVYNIAEINEDPHFKARNMIAEVEQPGVARPVAIVNTPIHMSDTPGGVRQRAPLLGEHTDAVLSQFGYSADEIAALHAAQAVRGAVPHTQP